ncbi:ABC transporter substrate-binding protein [Patulibacter sp. NPDC049589]|uniref:ABC transporter substrate-binding protein n=1 Tax=Patulibacter sp. NPDC049589 TaxID=3154731 RepID=UPI00342A7D19
MRHSQRGALAVLCASVLALGACGSDDEKTTSSAASSGDATSTETAATSSSGAASQATVDVTSKFIGGTPGKADASKSPVVIGVVNQEGATPSFPEYLKIAEATAKLINGQLGGIGGHPVKIEPCIVQSEEDGQRCAADFVAKKVDVAVLTLLVLGNQSFYKTVGGKFPVLNSVAATGPDTTSPHVYNLDGGSGAVLNGVAVRATADGAKKIAILTPDNDAGRNTGGTILEPALKKLGATGKTAYFPEAATGPEMVQALQAAGAKDADRIVIQPSSGAQCDAIFAGMQQLGIQKPVITNPICTSGNILKSSPDKLDGLELVTFTGDTRVKSDTEAQAFKDAMDAYGAGKYVLTGYVGKTFSDVLAIAKFGNEIGADKLSPAAYEQAITTFKGPAFDIPGEMQCGHDKTQIGVCGFYSVVTQFKGGTWNALEPVKNGG